MPDTTLWGLVKFQPTDGEREPMVMYLPITPQYVERLLDRMHVFRRLAMTQPQLARTLYADNDFQLLPLSAFEPPDDEADAEAEAAGERVARFTNVAYVDFAGTRSSPATLGISGLAFLAADLNPTEVSDFGADLDLADCHMVVGNNIVYWDVFEDGRLHVSNLWSLNLINEMSARYNPLLPPVDALDAAITAETVPG